MNFTHFTDYYLKSLVKDPTTDYLFEKHNSDNWLTDHSAITSQCSLIIGKFESCNISSQYFAEFYIIPEIIKNIKENNNKEYIFLTKNTELENFIFDKIIKKFINKSFNFKKINDDIIKDIRTIELENKNTIAILESDKIFSIKYLIEYI